jgi:hypothetical protein
MEGRDRNREAISVVFMIAAELEWLWRR